jgi:hypothetical protein
MATVADIHGINTGDVKTIPNSMLVLFAPVGFVA